MEYYSAKTTLNKGSQMQKATYYIIPIIWNFQNRQVRGDRKQISDFQDWGAGSEKVPHRWLFKVEGYFRGNGNILELDSGEACTTFWMY